MVRRYADVQAQHQAQTEGDLIEHENSMDKVVTAQGAGFAHVGKKMVRMEEGINSCGDGINQLDTSIKSILERLEILEKQNADKDILLNDLNSQLIELTGKSCRCSGGGNVKMPSSGSGNQEDPFELCDSDDEASDASYLVPPVVKVMTSPDLEYGLGEVEPDSEEEVEEKSQDDLLRVKEEEGELGLSFKGDIPMSLGCWLFPDC